MGRKLVFGRDQLIPLVLQDELYAACPWLATVQQLKNRELPAWQQSQTGCCGGDASKLFGTLDELLRCLRAAVPAEIASLRQYLASRYNSAATPLVIYYRKSAKGHPTKLEL